MNNESDVRGEFTTIDGERYYAIKNVDQIPPFFVSVVSSDDHWLFVSSTGGLSAGRVSPETALFPYVTVDKIHDSYLNTGCRTVVRLTDGRRPWEPFNREQDGRYRVSRNLYKNLLGSRLRFEEINHDLGLEFRYTWTMSVEHGFVRQCELVNTGDAAIKIDLLDGMQNMLPAGTPRFTQTNSSNLVDAYKWTELDEETGLAYLILYSGISDRAEPCESLRATTVYSLGLEPSAILLSNNQFESFRHGGDVTTETHTRGIRCAYFACQTLELAAGAGQSWLTVANTEQTQTSVVSLKSSLKDDGELAAKILDSVVACDDELARIMASADGFQATGEENVSGHHYSNVLFNVLRGGIFDDQYQIYGADFAKTIRHFNHPVYKANRKILDALPETLSLGELWEHVGDSGDAQLSRLTLEYLPITFGRRHGDPSRPWNQFAIRLKDEHGHRLLSYEGNWRDIFQNWEALSISYPAFLSSIIAKFVNASTADGYNPYRITKEGIDWEVEEPDDPWSYIGYWGDHQIIYLLKLLELSVACYPDQLKAQLKEKNYAYANVPYRIKPYADLVANPKDTVVFDDDLAEAIEKRLETIGADGKLILNGDNEVYQVTLIEKLLVPLLSKLGNLVVDGGIWMNTQRPEWNDANNALVGNGLSMVTLYYMRRYVVFMQDLLASLGDDFQLSGEVHTWLTDTQAALADIATAAASDDFDSEARKSALDKLGKASDVFRAKVYAQDGFTGSESATTDELSTMLENALSVIDRSIGHNRREDGLYEAYNLLDAGTDGVDVDNLYVMLEGQVGALSSGAIPPGEAADILEKMFSSDLYRDDQNTFMLYPDRALPRYMTRNRVTAERVVGIPLISAMLEKDDRRLIEKDANGDYRFNSDFVNAGDIAALLDELVEEYGELVAQSRDAIHSNYEEIFDHKAFTGRSGTMFGFEGLGSVYWHMVSKLLLAAMEVYFKAVDDGADEATIKRIGDLYYRVRGGIGFNKTPAEYGAFPLDAYSHTPKHAGASQPGMTGQVKEEIVARFAELGVRINKGAAWFQPVLLRKREFLTEDGELRYLDVADNWQTVALGAGQMGFTWCQVPVVYTLSESTSVELVAADGSTETADSLSLSTETTRSLIDRTGAITQINVSFPADMLLSE